MFSSEKWFGAPTGFYDYNINQSLRFEDADSAYLTRTNSSAGNRRTWTFSAWVKRGDLDSSQNYILGGTTDNYNLNWAVFFFGSDELTFYSYTGSENYQLHTHGVFRDPSAWYHLVLAWDTTQSTAADRIILYVNGSRQALETYREPSLNYEEAYINNNIQQDLGKAATAANGYDGYMAEVHFVDGTALAPTSFGETKAGIWIPKEYTGSHGTNGYYLDFADGSALGDDESGNGNDFTPNGVAATDVMLDSPTNNFATWNPLDNLQTSLFSEGNLKIGNTTGSHKQSTRSTFAVEHNFYFEFHRVDASTRNFNVGVATATASISSTSNTGVYTKNYSGGAGDIVMFAYSATANALWTGLNGTWDNSASVAEIEAGTTTNATHTSIADEPIAAVFIDQASSYSGRIIANFGQDSSFAGTETAQGNTDDNGNGDFYYSPPSGFLALCSANLPDPAIDPAQDEEPADYFNTVLYTGTSSTRSVTGVGFQPDWVWIKQRTGTAYHNLYDSLRIVSGDHKRLYSNEKNAEESSTYLGTTNLTSFDSDGFSVGDGSDTNNNTSTYVAWNWLAGGSAVTNNVGSIQSSVSANAKAGFSIVSYTGTGATSQQTIGVGLSWSGKDKLVITKNRDDNTYNWGVNSNLLSSNKVLSLNTYNDDSQENSAHYITYETSGFRTYNGTNILNLSDNYIAYCFHSVDGYSKIGTYTGNGSPTGPFVYTGFRPAFLLVKRIQASTNGWYIYDNKRNNFGTLVDVQLYANLANGDDDGNRDLDFMSNGFKPRLTDVNVNASGGTYIYLAFAEQPFKYANAR